MSKVGGQRMVILAYGNPLEGTVEHGRTCSPRWARVEPRKYLVAQQALCTRHQLECLE